MSYVFFKIQCWKKNKKQLIRCLELGNSACLASLSLGRFPPGLNHQRTSLELAALAKWGAGCWCHSQVDDWMTWETEKSWRIWIGLDFLEYTNCVDELEIIHKWHLSTLDSIWMESDDEPEWGCKWYKLDFTWFYNALMLCWLTFLFRFGDKRARHVWIWTATETKRNMDCPGQSAKKLYHLDSSGLYIPLFNYGQKWIYLASTIFARDKHQGVQKHWQRSTAETPFSNAQAFWTWV